jgi:ring-1,2-phenylacetyl-CoA epoxidase subunit PaaB
MMNADTQWPAYVVFHQAQEGRPHLHAGSVHAPDPELAMMNARDVFVRRPPCVSIWVAPLAAVFSRTREQLAQPGWATVLGERLGPNEREMYLVFKKNQHAGACTYFTQIKAESAPLALSIILENDRLKDGLVWWVIPAREVSRSHPDEIESMFSPAETKPFRHQSDFDTLTQMRRLAAEEAKREPDET